jgi:hypothetical protein
MSEDKAEKCVGKLMDRRTNRAGNKACYKAPISKVRVKGFTAKGDKKTKKPNYANGKKKLH